jgi:hypothetical protein
MKKLMLVTATATFALLSGVAGAVTLTNHDKNETTVSIEVGGKKEELKLKSNGVFDSKGQDTTITLGKEKPVSGKGSDAFIIKGGKIEMVKPVTDTKAPEAAKTEVKTEVKTELKTETAPVAPAAEAVKTEAPAPVKQDIKTPGEKVVAPEKK